MLLFKKMNSPVKTIWLALLVCILGLVWGCSADYDEFGESPYCDFDEIHFAGEAAGIQVFADEHKVVITLEELSDSLATWDSVTIESIDISHMATLHLVESKIIEFPTDSAGLDSLANQVAYVEKKLKKGQRLRLPASRVLYVLVVAEDGSKSIWKLQFEIPGEKSPAEDSGESGDENSDKKGEDAAKSSDNSISLEFKDAVETKSSGDTVYVTYSQGFDIKSATLTNVVLPQNAKVSPDPKTIKDWSVPQKIKVTAEDGSEKSWVIVVSAIKSNATDLQLLFKDQFKVNRSQDTVYIKLKNGSSIGSATIDSWNVSAGASVDPEPDAVKAWKDYQSFKVTAEDGTVKTWVLALSIATADETVSSDKELVSISAVGEESAATVDKTKKTVELHLAAGANLSAVTVTLNISEAAFHSLPGTVDLRSPVAFTITAEDGSSDSWTLSASVPAEPPRILSMKIAGNTAMIDSTQDGGTYTYNVHYDDLAFLADLTSLVVSDVELTKGATISGVTDGGSYDLGRGIKVAVSNGKESVEYEIRAGYQYPNSDLESWDTSKKKPTNWDNGNQTSGLVKAYMTQPVQTSQSGNAASMKSQTVAGLSFASGNLFIGTFNPKSVGQLAMTGYDDGNELIDFGKPFKARPRYLEVDFKYENNAQDSCDIYIFLENRTRTADNGSNVGRGKSDVNTLVASAWYRAKTDNSLDDPDVVSISERNSDGLRHLKLKLKYGQPYSDSPIMNVGSGDGKVSALYAGSLANSKGIDNHLVTGDGSQSVTHIRIVAASSADGNHYRGTEGATLVVDNFRLVY